MAAFQFPDPAVEQTVINTLTGSTYQWKEDPGKWVITAKLREVSDIIWEGDDEPNPNPGDYKLWYHTDKLELYFWYEDVNGIGAWVPTSAPITMLEDLDTGLSEVKLELVAANIAINENTNRIESFIYFGEEAPVIYPDVDTGGRIPDGTDEGAPIFEQDERNYKLWLNTTTDKLSALRIDGSADAGYSYQEIDTDNNVTLQEVLTNGNIANKSIVLTNASDDALLLSPEEGRIMVGGVGEDVVPKIELRHTTGVLDTSLVALELDEDGSRFDVECDEKVDNIHFRFGEADKLVLNKDGDAIFRGDVDIDGDLDVEKGIRTSGNAYMKFSSPDGKNQLLTLDSGSSYLPMLHLKSYSSTATTDGEEIPDTDTFGRKDVLIVRANGEAELFGHLSLLPGNRDNQAVTYNQLLELEQEIEALVPSIERGRFEISFQEISTDSTYDGKFNLLREFGDDDKTTAETACYNEYSECIFDDFDGVRNCQQELETCFAAIPAVGSMVTTNDFEITRQLKFSNKDIEGNGHNWSTIEAGQFIEIFNHDDDSYLIAEVTATEGTETEIVTISVTPLKYKGAASGVCRIKIFELDLSAGSDLDFVRKDGENKVQNDWKISSTSKTHFHVKDGESRIYWLQEPNHAQHPVTLGYADANYAGLGDTNAELSKRLLKTGDTMSGKLETTKPIHIRPDGVGANGNNNMLVVNQQSSKGQASIARFQQDGDDIIKVQYDKTTTFNFNRIVELGDPEEDADAVNKQWVENYVAANVRRLWKWTGDQSTTPGEGKFSWAQSGAGYCYFDHRPFIGSELYCSGNQYFAKGGDGLSSGKELGFAFMTLWEWTGSRWEPVKSGHLSASGVRTGKNNEPWRFSADKNSILKLKDMTTDGLYAICIAGTVLT